MQKFTENPTNRNKVQHQHDANTSNDADDHAKGLHNPNDLEAVRTAWSSGRIYRGYSPVEITPLQELTLQLPQDIVAFYQAKGELAKCHHRSTPTYHGRRVNRIDLQ